MFCITTYYGGDDMSYSKNFALIVVLFILLIIVGSAFVRY
ncbi:YjcZ family sporulation protein [Bacillus paralicheniformis]